MVLQLPIPHTQQMAFVVPVIKENQTRGVDNISQSHLLFQNITPSIILILNTQKSLLFINLAATFYLIVLNGPLLNLTFPQVKV